MKVGVSRWKGTSESLEDPQGSGVYFGISGGGGPQSSGCPQDERRCFNTHG